MTELEPQFSPEPLPPGTRVALRVAYDGSRYNGWQAQPHPGTRTVQQTLEAALSAVASAPVRVHCAGRTDTGVHGHGQVVHFEAAVARSPKAWVLGTNASLPADVRVHWARKVPADFHARFSASWRRYRYIVVDCPIRPAQLLGQITWVRYPLDAGLMNEAARSLLGEQDFSAFRAAACQSSSPFRDVHSVGVSRRGPFVVIDIRANAFLHHMVRNIAGSLIAVGTGRRAPAWIGELLAGRDRGRAADTASAQGLYLVEVGYPEHFELPATPAGPLLLGGTP